MKIETNSQFKPFKVNGIAGIEWGSQSDCSPVVLFLHGWLDNLNSFKPLMSHFNEHSEYRYVAIDFPGHGESDWRVTDGFYYFNDYVSDVFLILNRLKIGKCHIVGHSMGALVASVFSNCFPDKVESLSLIDGVGLLFSKPEETKLLLTRAIEQKSKLKITSNKPFKNIEDIYKARQRVSDLKLEDIKVLMNRNIKVIGGGFLLRTDPKLKLSSPFRYTYEQASALLDGIRSPTLLLLGSRGFEDMRLKLKKFEHCYTDLVVATVDGGHHCHMDSPLETFSLIMDHITGNHRSKLYL